MTDSRWPPLRSGNEGGMKLYPEEIRWALEIKEAIKASVNVQNVPDLEYAQWAIATCENQNVEAVLERAYKMQCFREQYKVGRTHQVDYDPLEEGMELIRGYMKMQPNNILRIDYASRNGHYIFVFDYAQFKSTCCGYAGGLDISSGRDVLYGTSDEFQSASHPRRDRNDC